MAATDPQKPTSRARRPASTALRALTSGALALPGLAGSAQADGAADLFALEYAFTWYNEGMISLPKSWEEF